MLAAPAAALAISAGGWRIDFGSTVSGREAIYSADASGGAPLAVVSPDEPTSVFSPLPSPDGRRIVFGNGGRELIARGDGSGAVVLTRTYVQAAAWSPDSTRIAWLEWATGIGRLHVARADGSGGRVVHTPIPTGWPRQVVWSHDGRSVRVRVVPTRVVVSPDGRWIAASLSAGGTSGFAVRRAGTSTTVAQAAGTSPTWSPDSRLLAYATASGIAVLDVQTGGTRLLTSDEGSLLRWSPDGTMLAYVDCCDLRTVTPTGSVRTVAPGADADFVADLEWTRAAPGLAYRPAAASVSLADVYTTFPVKLLAADGDRVAYASCGGFYLWTPDDGSAASGGSVLTLVPHVTPVVPAQTPADACVTRVYEDPYALALAGDRLAYTTVAGANNQLWAVRTVEFGQSPQLLTSGGAGPCCTSYPVVAAHGSLAVYAYRTGADDIWTVRVPGGQPLLSFRQSRFAQVALHVDGDRVLVARAGAVDVVLSENGGTVFHLDVPGNPSPPPNQQKPPDAQLDGPFVAVRDGGVVDVYAVDGGALVHTWPLPDGSTLQDAAHGLLAVSANGEIDVLRLTDGLRTRVAAGTLAAFLRNGLAIANGAHVSIAPNSMLPSTR